MKQVKLLKVGKLVKAHGVHGNLLLKIDSNILQDLLHETILEKEWIFVEINGIPIPFFIVENGVKQSGSNGFLIKLDGIDANEAKKLCPADVFVNTFYIDSELEITENYNEIEHFAVIDKELGTIGEVKYFMDVKENPLIAVNYNEKEILIPIQSEYILRIDFDTQQICTNFPNDYLEALI